PPRTECDNLPLSSGCKPTVYYPMTYQITEPTERCYTTKIGVGNDTFRNPLERGVKSVLDCEDPNGCNTEHSTGLIQIKKCCCNGILCNNQ
ncbi:unnamed protein product, partial [Didymodactylos carnosus]